MPQDPTTAAFRFGFGLPLPKGAPIDPSTMLAALGRADEAASLHPGVTLAEMTPLMDESDRVLRIARRGTPEEAAEARKAYRSATGEIETMAMTAARAQLTRALDAPDGLRERLVWFWADHFTTRARSRRDTALPSALIDEAIRPHVTGRFADMLKAAMQHPAMLVYLDQTVSFGPNSRFGQRRGKGLNENLARELLELHTLGTGYDQTDVTQMAELLTGLTLGKRGVTFDARRQEPGPETVLGRAYGGDNLAAILTALEDLATAPQTAAHLARKLAVHFVSDVPDPDLVAAIEMAWRNSGGDLLAVTGALISHPAAWAPGQAKARQPQDFMVAALRALGITGADLLRLPPADFRRLVLHPLGPMGQPWQAPPGPDGWPEAPAHWITPEGMAARITWAMEMPQHLTRALPDPRAMAERALGRHLGERLAWALPRSESPREAVGLILASPEFNRR